MKKNRAQKDILYISISSFVLVVLWVGFNLYHAYVTSTIEPDLQIKILPIEPRFDTETIEKLKTREKITPLYESDSASPEAVVAPLPTSPELPSVSEAPIPLPTDSVEELTP